MKPLKHSNSLGTSSIKGFTLVEMVVTLAIAAILATIAVPAFDKMLEYLRARRATESMVAAFYNAKSEAIKRNTFIRLVFTTSNAGATWCHGLTDVDNCDCTQANSCVLDGVERVVSSTQFRGISAAVSADSANRFNFNPLRGTVNAGNVQFTSDTQGYQSRAVISGVGRITMCSDATAAGYMGAFKAC